MEDHRRCPHCGGELRERPYLMSRGERLVWSPLARRAAYVVLGTLWLVAIMRLL